MTAAQSQRLHPASTPDRILYRLNAGGPRIAAIDEGPDWLKDDGFYGGVTQVVTGRPVRGIDRSVPPSTPQAVFETERFHPSRINVANMTYRLPVAQGIRIALRLYFMNGFERTSEPGQRVFDVRVDGRLVLNNVDLSAEFGHRIGGMHTVGLESDGVVDIEFEDEVQASLVSAIEVLVIERGDAPTPVANVLSPQRGRSADCGKR